MSLKSKAAALINRLSVSDKSRVPDNETTSNNLLTVEEEQEQRLLKEELDIAKKTFEGFDRDHVWAFISGQFSEDFRGNPKYLFVYINKYRPDIKAYWLCNTEDTINQVRDLGFIAYYEKTPAAQHVINRTGVLVVEQVKYVMPDGFDNVKYINLWHGIGFKTIERRLFLGDIAMGFARKYVHRGTFYRDHQLMNASCPVIESEYTNDIGVEPDKFLRTGYPRCLYQQNYDPVISFDHDLRKIKGLPETTKLVVYAPTYRAKLGGTFSRAIPDFEKLYNFCESNNILLIFKVHPNMEKEVGFLKAWEEYGERSHFWFWDNRYDFYEIMHMMDLAIVDYSGIISDMIAMGIPHYIRYLFDYEDYMSTVSIHDNYLEKTTGIIVSSFGELLDAISTYEARDESAEINRLNADLWSYSEGKKDFDRIIDAAFNFEIKERSFPTLYSFDVFDTLFTRKVLDPKGVFYLVKEKMLQSGMFPFGVTYNYPEIRRTCESNVREYYSKSEKLRNSDRREITFDEIFSRMADVYDLSDEQIDLLKKWELEVELDNVIPLDKQICLVKELLEAGNKVILISDMYLPKEFVQQLLYKADPVLAELPLFLSNEYGVLKTSQKLFFEVYKSFEPYYDFKKWIHYGDNPNADVNQPRKFRINARKVDKPSFNNLQKDLVKQLGTYDSYLVAAMQARLLSDTINRSEDFVTSFIALCFVPYIDWVLRDAIKRGYESLYFVSRDGHHLKRIADVIISSRNLNIKTKYIYASRRTWRIPSFINKVDEGFWEDYGSFGNITEKRKLFSAMDLDEETFNELFPYITPDNIDFSNRKELKSVFEIFKNSQAYDEYLMEKARQERVLVSQYLEQEISKDENFAIVEYYGRGYTQDCFVNLWRDIVKEDVDVPFYYSRSVLPSANGAIRHNFTSNDSKQYFIESIFANMPYKSIEEYYVDSDGVIRPVIKPISYNEELFNAMERILPLFAEKYAKLDLLHPEGTDRMLYDFMFSYYSDNLDNPDFAESIGQLIDSVALYGTKREYAPPFTMDLLEKFENKELRRSSMLVTTSMTMSVTRSADDVKRKYAEMYQILPGDKWSGGRLLSQNEQVNNASFKEKYEKALSRAAAFSEAYKTASSECEVSNKIVILSEGKTSRGDRIDLIENGFKNQNKYEIQTILLGKLKKKDDKKVAVDLAAARYIIICKPVALLCKTRIREESALILAPSFPFALYNKGLQTVSSLKWQQKHDDLINKNDISILQVPAPSRESFFMKCYCSRLDVKILTSGNYNTDIYFDEQVRNNSVKTLVDLFPEAANKKRILYAPKWRTRSDYHSWQKLLDLELLKDQIGDEYVVICWINKKQVIRPTWNTVNIPGFSIALTEGMTLREAMLACDVIIGDYNDTFFEAPILHKPAFSTAYDYEEMITSKNMTINANHFEDLIFCPVIRNEQALISHLKNIDQYDYSQMESFYDNYLSMCNGHSVENLVNYLIQQE